MRRPRARLVGAKLATVVSVAALALAAACQPPKKGPPDLSTPTLAIDTGFVTGLSNPWDMAFLGDGTMFFTQRSGAVSVKLPGAAPTNLGTPPGSAPSGEGGVMGIAVDPNFAANRFLYVCYTHTDDNRVVRFTVPPAFTGLGSPQPLVTGIDKAQNHNGCRIRFGFDGMLWITAGDAQDPSLARDLDSLNGKVLRVHPATGDAAPGNPFPGNEVWTSGHRNVQGLAFRINGEAYGVEHGPERDDEVNLLVAGGDYGWVGGSVMTAPGAIPAVWSSGFPTIAPSGATFLYGTQWKGWNGALVLAVLKDRRLQVFVERGGALQFASPEIVPTGVRLRSVVLGPDGNLYVATDVGGGGGAIWRVVPG